MKNIKKWMAAAGIGLALMTATVVALPVAAADTVAAAAQHGSGQSDEYLAQALGVSADELEAAKQTAYQAALDQALAEGLITQEQADAIQERSSAAGRLSSRYLRGLMGSDGSSIDVDALLADALEITTDELDVARAEAQDLALAAAVADGSITQEQADQRQAEQALKSYLDEQGYETQVRTLYENLVQQAVQAGVITQEQADTILSDSSMGRFGGMRGLDGGRSGRHGSGDAGRMGPAGIDTTTSDSAGL